MAILTRYRFKCFQLILPVILTGTGIAFSQEQKSFSWAFDGDIRYRFEKWNNMNAMSYGNPPEIGSPGDYILMQRIIAGTTIRANNHFTVSAHLQDSRAFGWSLASAKEPDAFKIHPENSAEPFYTMNPQEEFFDLYDASIRIDSIFQLLSIIAGRQKIAYGDYRVFGPGSWGNTGRWNWDAVNLIVERQRWKGSVWYGGTKIHDPRKTYLPFTNTEYYGGGIHLQFRPSGFTGVDFYMAHKHQGRADFIRNKSINRNWAGFRIYNPESSSMKYEASYTREFGMENQSRLNGSGLFLLTGLQWRQLNWKPCITFRYSLATGNDPETVMNEKFDPVFGAGDRYYGWMNMVKWTNLDDREIMLELYPVDGMRIEFKYNRFRIPQPEGTVVNGNIIMPPGKKHLGDEVDLFAKYDFNENWQFVSVLGYFIMQDGQTVLDAEPGNAFLVSLQVLYRFSVNLS